MIAIIFLLEFRKGRRCNSTVFPYLVGRFFDYLSFSGKRGKSCILLTSILILIQVDLDGLIMARQLSIFIIGQDVLKTNGEVLLLFNYHAH